MPSPLGENKTKPTRGPQKKTTWKERRKEHSYIAGTSNLRRRLISCHATEREARKQWVEPRIQKRVWAILLAVVYLLVPFIFWYMKIPAPDASTGLFCLQNAWLVYVPYPCLLPSGLPSWSASIILPLYIYIYIYIYI